MNLKLEPEPKKHVLDRAFLGAVAISRRSFMTVLERGRKTKPNNYKGKKSKKKKKEQRTRKEDKKEERKRSEEKRKKNWKLIKKKKTK